MAGHSEVDWMSIKADYVNAQGSYRQLAEKYGVKKDTIARRAQKEGWARQRDRQRDTLERRIMEKSTEKIAAKMAEAYSDQAVTRNRIKSKLLKMAERWIDEQNGQITDAGDYRRIVQCCMDMLEAADYGSEQKLRVIMEGDAEDYAQ